MLRGRSRIAATSKMERFVLIVCGFQPLTIITKRSILDVAAALDPPQMLTASKVSRYRVCSSVFSRIQSKCGKIRARKTPYLHTFRTVSIILL